MKQYAHSHGTPGNAAHAGKEAGRPEPETPAHPSFGVKEAVFPFNMFPEVDPILGPEMRSTSGVLGMADSFGQAYFKAQEGALQRLPTEGTVLITTADTDKQAVLHAAQHFAGLGFKIKATRGTHQFLVENGIASERIDKLHEGRPNIVDAIKNKEIQLVVNTPAGKLSKYDDSYIRKAAIKYKVPYLTTPSLRLSQPPRALPPFAPGAAGSSPCSTTMPI